MKLTATFLSTARSSMPKVFFVEPGALDMYLLCTTLTPDLGRALALLTEFEAL